MSHLGFPFQTMWPRHYKSAETEDFSGNMEHLFIWLLKILFYIVYTSCMYYITTFMHKVIEIKRKTEEVTHSFKLDHTHNAHRSGKDLYFHKINLFKSWLMVLLFNNAERRTALSQTDFRTILFGRLNDYIHLNYLADFNAAIGWMCT